MPLTVHNCFVKLTFSLIINSLNCTVGHFILLLIFLLYKLFEYALCVGVLALSFRTKNGFAFIIESLYLLIKSFSSSSDSPQSWSTHPYLSSANDFVIPSSSIFFDQDLKCVSIDD